MKQRIVAKLADIALAASGNVTPEMLKNTAYLKEFSEEPWRRALTSGTRMP